MLLRMVVDSVGGNAGGPKLVVMRPAAPVDPNNDPNSAWTAPGGKASAELRIYLSNQEHYDDFVQGSVYEVNVETGTKASQAQASVSAAPKAASTSTPSTGTGSST